MLERKSSKMTQKHYKTRHIKLSRVMILISGIACLIVTYFALYDYFKPIEAQMVEIPMEITIEDKQPLEDLVEEMPSMKYIGNYRITYYCPCERCNGKGNEGLDCTGHKLEVGTIASNDFPIGTKLVICVGGMSSEYVVRDRMNARYTGKNCIDVFVNIDHQACQNLGVVYADVFQYTE